MIVDELGEEFSAKGLKLDSEPNAYGLEIKTLTDACGLAWDDLRDPSGGRHTDDPPPRKQTKPSDLIDPAR